MPPRIISIEGNIGSGKSTMVEYLKQNLQNDFIINLSIKGSYESKIPFIRFMFFNKSFFRL